MVDGNEHRRGYGRRAVDVQHAVGALRQARGLAWTALILLAVTTTAAAVALGFGYVKQLGINDHSTRALEQSTRALRKSSKTLALLHNQLVGACIRLNIERAKTNRSNLADYYVDGVVLSFSERPAAPETAQARQFERAFLPKLRYAVSAKQWTPLTNCAEAVSRNQALYPPPDSIQFARRLPPPSVLDTQNAKRLVPAGSVY